MRNFHTCFFKKINSKADNAEHELSTIEVTKEEEKSLPTTKKKVKKRQKNPGKNIKSSYPFQDQLSISSQKMKMLVGVGEIRLDPDKAESAFMARQLVQATLPHKNPGSINVWERSNGNFSMFMQPGYKRDKHKKVCSIGLPYGTKPRLVMAFISSEAVIL